MALRPPPPGSKVAATVPQGDVPVPTAADLDYHLKTFWEKYSRPVLAGCCVILVAIISKGGWDYVADQREAETEKAFAAATTPDLQKAFAAAHPDHPLAGVAELQLGDAAYASNQISDALVAYSQAFDILKTGPLAARAELGLALSKIQTGRTDEGEQTLRQLANDPQGFKPVRSEAAYHLASLAAAAGRTAELQSLSTQLMQIDPDSPWTERVFALQAEQTASAQGKPAMPSPLGVSIKP